MSEQKDIKKYIIQKKNDYSRIKGFLDELEANGLDIPKLQYIKHIKNILDVMLHDDSKFIEAPVKKVKLTKGFE